MVMGKTKKEDFNKEAAKNIAVEIEKKRHPLQSRSKIRKKVEKASNKIDKKNGIKM